MAGTLRTSQYTAVGAASAKFANAMADGFTYRFTANTDCWVLIGATGASAAANTANNHLVITGQALFFTLDPGDDGTNGFVHVIRDSADGDATLSKYE